MATKKKTEDGAATAAPEVELTPGETTLLADAQPGTPIAAPGEQVGDYVKQTWNNGDKATPLSAERLNHMEDGIASGNVAPAAPTWASVTGKPATFPPTVGTAATDAMAGNTALLKIGTTATTAAAGNHDHTVAADAASGLEAAANIQALAAALSTRIKALEDAANS